MARQIGIIKIKGSIGDLSFYESGGMQLVRKKTGATKKQIEADPRFERTKENAQEFGRTMKSCKLLKQQLQDVLFQCTDKSFFNRLVSRMSMVIKSDPAHRRGERMVTGAGLELLGGLETNRNFKFKDQVLTDIDVSFDVIKGEGIVTIPAFIPAQRIRRYETSTHAQLVSAVIEFGAVIPAQIEAIVWRSVHHELSGVRSVPGMKFSFARMPKPENALIVLLGICYFEQISGSYFPVAKGKYNAMLFDKIYC
ncbi:MAG: hypothetical protein LBF27_24980 [Sphingobacterium sp.]|jgi:hypothetical protein|nr:hypothetical protein [Sphingobacterium sp.]